MNTSPGAIGVPGRAGSITSEYRSSSDTDAEEEAEAVVEGGEGGGGLEATGGMNGAAPPPDSVVPKNLSESSRSRACGSYERSEKYRYGMLSVSMRTRSCRLETPFGSTARRVPKKEETSLPHTSSAPRFWSGGSGGIAGGDADCCILRRRVRMLGPYRKELMTSSW